MSSQDAANAQRVASASSRKECWDARDAFFACADASSEGQVEARCAREWEAFNKRCLPSWVKHFMMQRNLGSGKPPGS